MFGPVTSDAGTVANSIANAAAAVETRTASLTRHHRQLLLTTIQARHTKRTGAMAGSYHIDATGVSSEHPGARRHEMGFHGVDARGARRSDPPHPNVGPAADAVEEVFELALEAQVATL